MVDKKLQSLDEVMEEIIENNENNYMFDGMGYTNEEIVALKLKIKNLSDFIEKFAILHKIPPYDK